MCILEFERGIMISVDIRGTRDHVHECKSSAVDRTVFNSNKRLATKVLIGLRTHDLCTRQMIYGSADAAVHRPAAHS